MVFGVGKCLYSDVCLDMNFAGFLFPLEMFYSSFLLFCFFASTVLRCLGHWNCFFRASLGLSATALGW